MQKRVVGAVAICSAALALGASAQTNTFPASGNVGIGTTTPSNLLSINGAINAGGNYYNVLSYAGVQTSHGIFIQTQIPFANQYGMTTVVLEGFDEGPGETIGLLINWYVYGSSPNFVDYSVSSFGAYTPQIELSNNGGLVAVFINDQPYYARFGVRAYDYLHNDSPSYYNGWTVADQAISGTNVVTVPYKNNFAGNVGIGTTAPAYNLDVANNACAVGHLLFWQQHAADDSLDNSSLRGRLCRVRGRIGRSHTVYGRRCARDRLRLAGEVSQVC